MTEGHHQLYYYMYHQGLRHTMVNICQIENIQLKISGKPNYDRVSSEHKYLLCQISKFFRKRENTRAAVKQRLTAIDEVCNSPKNRQLWLCRHSALR